jgi:hypothetical protein
MAFLVQIAFLGQLFVTDIGRSVLFFLYALPFLLAATVIESFHEMPFGPPDSFLANFLVLCVQAAVYSPIFGGIVYGIVCLVRRGRMIELKDV